MSHQERKSYLALTLATLAFAACFSVWTLYSILGIELQRQLNLSSTEFGLLLAAPIFTGAIFRIPIGFLAEKVSCRSLFFWQMLSVVPPLFYLPYVETFSGYITLGFLIGISGVSFTIGIRYVTDWFETKHQGFALGVFGAGNAGAAITLVLVPLVVEFYGWKTIGTVYGFGMIFMAILFRLFAPEVNAFYKNKQQTKSFEFYWEPLKQLQVWRFGLYYYFVFGSFLALLLWLPQYYVSAYGLSLTQSLALTLLFVTSSSIVRAVGGWFADTFGARTVNWSAFWICMVCLFFLSYPPTTMTVHGVEKDVTVAFEVNVWLFTLLIVIIGLAQGFGRASIYKTIYDYYPHHMGSVGGVVAAVGALGGCTLPILFGLSVDVIGVYSACFMLLYGVLALCMVVMYFAIRAEREQKLLKEAIANNFLEKD
ncbi:major facilitator superfamily MFS_1 [Shewanella halifaxensis HAW-EB4]|uniref:Major facilitator superfamily MFS_1 n=1 Tax=Shewanella halifaxensis (strain HAW-EB4) TaxID=458817 RepID=B0TN37_SHEHH|nr:MFS transporter [Shewanella halifaxensis]ABZ74749.1 major facilitator superfamily MFS_1 [Shewanella halifaxensis HAW-EB4]